MKRADVKPGVSAMLSLGGRRGAIRVTVVRQTFPDGESDDAWTGGFSENH